MSNFSTQSQSLDDWLCYLESIHPQEIELGLDRVKQVANQLNLLNPRGRIILVGGTNGKGSTCAYIEQLILASGATTGVFSSPHIIRYNERLRINGQELDDHYHVDALRYINSGRDDTELTYFEFNTLAALKIMADLDVDFLILEVGLGGRLDSTNIVDAEVAVITTIDLDHQAWLGDTRELVAFEKAGIFRQHQRVVCGEPNPPQTLVDHAKKLHCDILYKTVDFNEKVTGQHWMWRTEQQCLSNLPVTKLPITNASTALQVFALLGLNFSVEKIHQVLATTVLPGRLQSIGSSPEIVLDVAHNPQAGGYLANWLKHQDFEQVHCVCAMLGDKDSQSTLKLVAEQVNHWYLADLDVARGAKAQLLAQSLPSTAQFTQYHSVNAALANAKLAAKSNDLILVFGSFFTVAEVLKCIIE
ncbi:MAG: bifunctional tetrahydrofolate synthase/dihydrofolate synthase [Gammaproteobacteria bacterium]|nr:bifunctional tetrahydrofolate synthase/dihydrofolate synthase [Gammaproteobacteria bacterium]